MTFSDGAMQTAHFDDTNAQIRAKMAPGNWRFLAPD